MHVTSVMHYNNHSFYIVVVSAVKVINCYCNQLYFSKF